MSMYKIQKKNSLNNLILCTEVHKTFITNITIPSLGYNARAVLLCRNHGEFFVVTSFLTTKQLLPFLLDLKKNMKKTLDYPVSRGFLYQIFYK